MIFTLGLILFAATFVGLLAAIIRCKRVLLTNSRYQDALSGIGLTRVDDFLALLGEIVSGHPDRNVSQVRLHDGTAAYLKREHYVPMRDRLASVWAGFGFVSKSLREAKMLDAARKAGLGCVDWIAAGENGNGRAFLLVKETPGVELRLLLQERSGQDLQTRRRFATLLGEALARIHAAGVRHGDLYSKHVLFDESLETFSFLDWQRARRNRRLTWRRRIHDLAALHATLADNLASRSDRLACLRAYLGPERQRKLNRVAEKIHARSEQLLRKRHIRAHRQPPLLESQRLVWLNGEALCLTPEFQASLGGRIPEWLQTPPAGDYLVVRTTIVHVADQEARLTWRRDKSIIKRMAAWFWRPATAPEVRQAGILFRLQRHGIVAPRLLAVGQRCPQPGRTESFLLTEPLTGTRQLADWLRDHRLKASQRRGAIREAALLLRRIHEAGCNFDFVEGRTVRIPFFVRDANSPEIVLGDVADLQTGRQSIRALDNDLRWTQSCLPSRADRLRFLLHYFGWRRLDLQTKKLARRLLRPISTNSEVAA